MLSILAVWQWMLLYAIPIVYFLFQDKNTCRITNFMYATSLYKQRWMNFKQFGSFRNNYVTEEILLNFHLSRIFPFIFRIKLLFVAHTNTQTKPPERKTSISRAAFCCICIFFSQTKRISMCMRKSVWFRAERIIETEKDRQKI